MDETLHIINGDSAGDCLRETNVSGTIFICRDLLYDGLRKPGWPDDYSLTARAQFLEKLTDGRRDSSSLLTELKRQYQKLAKAVDYKNIVLWFDACLCDQSMLAHILVCLKSIGINKAELINIDSFNGIEPFNGLGQLEPHQLASLLDGRRPVTADQFEFAVIVEESFAAQDVRLLENLSQKNDAPLPFMPAAAKRWLQELPDSKTGFGRLESLILEAIRSGNITPRTIFVNVAAAEVSPQFWGDTTLWQKINGLAERRPPCVCINGPGERLPQWGNPVDLNKYTVKIVSPCQNNSHLS